MPSKLRGAAWFGVGVVLSVAFGWIALPVILILWGASEVLAR